eukprot:1112887-Pelagomonas_calceolata.AAC.1
MINSQITPRATMQDFRICMGESTNSVQLFSQNRPKRRPGAHGHKLLGTQLKACYSKKLQALRNIFRTGQLAPQKQSLTVQDFGTYAKPAAA